MNFEDLRFIQWQALRNVMIQLDKYKGEAPADTYDEDIEEDKAKLEEDIWSQIEELSDSIQELIGGMASSENKFEVGKVYLMKAGGNPTYKTCTKITEKSVWLGNYRYEKQYGEYGEFILYLGYVVYA